jgi:hypothetical protein
VVAKIVPLSPTTHPLVGLANQTSLRLFDVPVACGVQVSPASDVPRSVPDPPTAHPVVSLVNATPFRIFVVPLA